MKTAKKLMATILSLMIVASYMGTGYLTVFSAKADDNSESLSQTSEEIIGFGSCGTGVVWSLNNAGTLTISGIGELKSVAFEDELPVWYSYIDLIKEAVIKDGVTGIGNYGFNMCSRLKRVTIPDSVTSIGNAAFAFCTSLTDIKIPDGVTSIGEDAFSFCAGLTDVTIPDSVTSIGREAFYSCVNLEAINIPKNITEIGDSVFDDTPFYSNQSDSENGVLYIDNCLIKANEPLSGEYKVKDGTKVIAGSAFEDCSNLTDIIIPDSLIGIGDNAFQECTGLTDITIPGSVTNIGDYAFQGCTGLTEITVPDSVTSIGIDTFCGCTDLTEITIPDGVTSIGDGAFSGCTNLADINIPGSVTDIGSSVLYSTAIYKDESKWDNGVLYICNCLITGKNISGEYTVKDGTRVIADGAFSSNKELTGITIPGSVTGIGNSAFEYCSGLTVLSVPAGVTYIGDRAFLNCTELTTVTIPASVTRIGECAFKMCHSLTDITISEGVREIGIAAFFECIALTDITIPASVALIGVSSFALCPCLKSLSVNRNNAVYGSPDNCNAIIETATGVLIIGCKNTEIPDGVTAIGNYAFYNCTNLNDITIPEGVISIGNYAFECCSGITGVTIPEGVRTIGIGAFNECTALTDITIPAGVTSIGTGAFWYTAFCKDDKNYENCAIYIGNYLIGVKDSVTGNVEIRQGTTLIADNAFADCQNITGVIIPNSVKRIGYGVFLDCCGLTEVKIPNGVKSIGYGAFACCEGLKSVTIPNNVEVIGDGAFSDCTALKCITIPDCVTNIGYAAFSGCESLTDVYYKGEESDKAGTAISYKNDELTDATWHYYETQTNSSKVSVSYFDNTFDTEVDLVVNGIDSNSSASGSYKLFEGKAAINVGHYEIHIKKHDSVNNSDNYVQPQSGCVKVRIPIPDQINESDYSKLYVYHKKQDGTHETFSIGNCNLKIIGKFLTFDVSSFSEFEIYFEISAENAKINIASPKTVDYKSDVTIKATAENVPEGYCLAIYVNGKQAAKGSNTEVSYTIEKITSNINYTVNVIDVNDNIQIDADGNQLSKDSTVNCNDNIFAKIIAFFRGLFGLLPKVEVKP